MSQPARTPDPPYYAVIFTSTRTEVEEGYGDASERMIELAAQQPGFLGVESARGADGLGITVSYWESEEAIANWRRNAEHRVVQAKGMERWYSEFVTRVAKVERARTFSRVIPSEDEGSPAGGASLVQPEGIPRLRSE